MFFVVASNVSRQVELFYYALALYVCGAENEKQNYECFIEIIQMFLTVFL